MLSQENRLYLYPLLRTLTTSTANRLRCTPLRDSR
nr:MAG TPA: hypothetical protein [Caudoviricetes sp.]